MNRGLDTRHGRLNFPAFIPVTTFGGAFALDELVRPYLSRLAPAVMVSYHYAQAIRDRPCGILFVDSGGFASLFEGAERLDEGKHVGIQTREGTTISAEAVLRFQEEHADIGATLDFIIPPECPAEEAKQRQDATIRNAIWAVENRRNSDLRLFASIQAWDSASALRIMERLAHYPFDGFALGGMVPRARRPETIFEITETIRSVDAERPLHVFGIGAPELTRDLFERGVDSVDSSNYVRAAVDGKRFQLAISHEAVLSAEHACACGICQRFGTEYLQLQGEANRMALALHNLAVLTGTLRPASSAPARSAG